MSREQRTTVRLMRPGVVVLVLGGRYAGRKAIIIKSYDDGSKEKPYGHALVVGIDRYPRRLVRRMGKRRMESRSKIKPFVKIYNYNHLMPTRHSVNIMFDTKLINKNALSDKGLRRKARLEAKLKLQQRQGLIFISHILSGTCRTKIPGSSISCVSRLEYG
ncbi:Ribosomal protein L27 [Fasciolopsis buskii]|uniref:Ribosomal protein L27 n=1 Tax=Fasciolopsis buskii TaxID=27845 RepID=A0A8E0VMM1_9TREM|nr:Ribosomal protein L27 [Fasciolopsis buski]